MIQYWECLDSGINQLCDVVWCRSSFIIKMMMIVVMNIKKSQIFLHSLEGKKNYQPGTPESN
jgi:hypothetical protein